METSGSLKVNHGCAVKKQNYYFGKNYTNNTILE